MLAAQVELRKIDDLAAEARAQGLAWLTPAERERLRTITAPARQEAFLAGHWQARKRAAQRLGLALHSIAWAVQARGRPQLQVAGEALPLHVSISHSDGWLAVAVADVPVGIDLELPRRPRDWRKLAAFVLTAEEGGDLEAHAERAQAALFRRLWALKEAHAKRSGQGLGVRAARERCARPTTAASAEAWTWDVGEGALALAGVPGLQVQWLAWDWPSPPAGLACWRYADANPRRRD